MKHRVWCKNKNEWEVDPTFIDDTGKLFFMSNGRLNQFARMENHILEYSTGLIDKNGIEIFEGDILRSLDSNGVEILHTVERNLAGACFCVWLHPINKWTDVAGGINQFWVTEFNKEVVGNIHSKNIGVLNVK